MSLDELRSLRDGGGPLGGLSDVELTELASALTVVEVAAGQPAALRGEVVEQAYIVLRGRLVVKLDDAGGTEMNLRVLSRGDCLTGAALPVRGDQSASVYAVDDCVLASLSHRAFESFLERDSESGRHITAVLFAWMRQSQLVSHLSALFGPFDPSEVEIVRELESEVERVTLAGGETLFRQGDPPDAAYIVMSGRLRVMAEARNGFERMLGEMGRGETIGELALLTDETRSATVFAVRDSDLARISRAGFMRLIERHPKSLRPLARIVADRLRRRDSGARSARRVGACVALIAVRPSVPLDRFAAELVAELDTHGRSILLSSAEVDRAFGVDGISQTAEGAPAAERLALWLHEREDIYRFVVYQADSSWTPWTERCARQSDRVLMVADARDGVERGNIEIRLQGRWLSARAPQRNLVLVHPADTGQPQGTARWLAERDIDAVYHVRAHDCRDVARLGRIVAGRAVGLVLGGGGGRGFAHLGVLRGLEELGIPVDMIGGSSIGAPVSLPCAMGRTAAEALDILEKGFRSLLDYTFPLVSLLAGRRIARAIEATCRGRDIEDLWLPFYCVSTDITTGRAVSHKRGDLLRAVRASVAIPGVLPPVPDGESLLVDGGVLNNLPIDVMREMNPTGIVIAVDVLSPRGPRAKTDYGLSLSGWRLLLRRLNPFVKSIAVPGLIATIMRSMFVGSDGTRERMLEDGLADLYINIRAPGIGMLEFDNIAKIADLGYEGAIDPLTAWAGERDTAKSGDPVQSPRRSDA